MTILFLPFTCGSRRNSDGYRRFYKRVLAQVKGLAIDNGPGITGIHNNTGSDALAEIYAEY